MKKYNYIYKLKSTKECPHCAKVAQKERPYCAKRKEVKKLWEKL